MAHTPTPWEYLEPAGTHSNPRITSSSGLVAEAVVGYGAFPNEAEANSHFIIRAVNSFEAMRDALSEIARDHKCTPGQFKLHAQQIARAALTPADKDEQ